MNKIKLSYLFPNLLTAASIFAGILSILYSIDSRFTLAIYMILLSGILDSLDGKVARMTNSQSQFGLEFDSIADTVAFGVAPGMLLYLSVAHEYGRLGILVTAIFIIFGAIRLAKFNAITHSSSVFLGLPIPSGAIFIASYIYILREYASEYVFVVPYLALGVAFLMVSNIRYPSFKQNLFGKQHILRVLVGVLLLLSLLYLYTIETVFVAVNIYTFWGISKILYSLLTRKIKQKEKNAT